MERRFATLVRSCASILFFVTAMPPAIAQAQVQPIEDTAYWQEQIRSTLMSFDRYVIEFYAALGKGNQREAGKLAQLLQHLGSIGILAPDGNDTAVIKRVNAQFERVTREYFDALLDRRMPQAQAALMEMHTLHTVSESYLKKPSPALTRLGCFKVLMEATYLSERIKVEEEHARGSVFNPHLIFQEYFKTGDIEHIAATSAYGSEVAKHILSIVRRSDPQYRSLNDWIARRSLAMRQQYQKAIMIPPKHLDVLTEFTAYTEIVTFAKQEFQTGIYSAFAADLFTNAQNGTRAYAMGQMRLAEANRNAIAQVHQVISCKNLESVALP